MLYWALVFLVIALVAGALGFGGIAGASAGIAKILFFIFLGFAVDLARHAFHARHGALERITVLKRILEEGSDVRPDGRDTEWATVQNRRPFAVQS